MLFCQLIAFNFGVFQSTPAITGGRCVYEPDLLPVEYMRFNPRPPLLAGDAEHATRLPHPPRVSIHARHYWRAMRFAHSS